MKRVIVVAVLWTLALAMPALAAEKVLFEQDFESEDAAKSITSKKTVLTEAGPESKHCISQTVVGKYNNMGVLTDVAVEDGMVLSFDYRTDVRAGKVGYMGIYLFTPEGKKMLATVKPTEGWKHAEVPLSKFKVDPGSKLKEAIKAGEKINEVQFYGRGDDKNVDQTAYVDNVKFIVK